VELKERMLAMVAHVINICEFDKRDEKRIIVSGITESHTDDNRYITITAQKSLEYSKAPLIINTPARPEWPQNEAVIASLYAYTITGRKKYKDRFVCAHNYFHERFPDAKYGECYGYFHRDGTLATPLKGNMYKGPFHIPRMYMEGAALLEKLNKKTEKQSV